MAKLFKSSPFTIPCANCKREIKRTVAWFKRSNLKCPFCNSVIDIERFRAELQKAEKAALNFFRDLTGN